MVRRDGIAEPGRESGVTERRVDDAVQQDLLAPWWQQQRVLRELVETDAVPPGQRMSARCGDDEVLHPEAVDGHPVVDQLTPDQCDVDVAGHHRVDALGEVLQHELDLDVGPFLPDRGDRGECALGERHVRGQSDAGRAFADHRPGTVGEFEDLFGDGEQAPAGLGDRDRPRRPLEQRHPEIALEAGDLMADGRLGHVQPFGGAGEAEVPADRHECGELSQLHPGSLAIDRRSR